MSAEQLSKEIADAVTGVMRKHGHFLDVRTCREIDAEIAARIKPLVETEEMVRYLRDAFKGCELHQHPGGTASFSVLFPKLHLDNCSALTELKILLYGREPEDEESEVTHEN